ncbi:PD-(D/E)XK nuclease family protein [Nocardia vulneris]|uniref:PD-(D/E)XK nuclease family protein n=1 Tax=Nocardia vulneris TaxID=1141657 RepID=UPI0005BD5E55|nr:PD-(D/E)XK nuclease family protein [Nocardia vulneris]
MTDYNIPRKYGKPFLLNPETGQSEVYERASTLAKVLDEEGGLTFWKQCMTAIGVVKRRSLTLQISSLISRDGDEAYDRNKKQFFGILKAATEAAGSGTKAESGTATHEFTEVIDRGEWPEYMPEEIAGPMRAYQEAMQPYRVVDNEPFVVVDKIRAAGSIDKLVERDGKVQVWDLKTGRSTPKYPLAPLLQLAIYAHGERYNPETGERSPLHENIDLTTGVMIHLPLEPVDGAYVCHLYELDLVYGWNAVLLALQVIETRKVPPLQRIN